MTTKQKTVALLTIAGAALGGVLLLNRPASGGPRSDMKIAQPVVAKKQRIQVALLLDTSSSMDGLIDQARTQMWNLVNELAQSTRHGSLPEVELALYEYGKPTLGAESGYIRQMAPLTTSLDSVSEALFALTTNGGDEFAGQVIQDAVKNLKWDKDPTTLKLIFIAGNEEFTQGPVDYHKAVGVANERGIIVNTVYCGSPTDGDAVAWADGARLSQGRALSINQNAVAVYVPAPQDAEIARLSNQLNSTYIAYGSGGAASKERQMAQDSNAAPSPSATVARAKTKAGGLYKNDSWDVVDKVASGTSVEEIDEGSLPAEMKALSKDERKAYVVKKQSERAELQGKIQKLSEDRDAFVAKTKPAAAGDATLDKAMVEAVREQASKKGFVFKKKK